MFFIVIIMITDDETAKKCEEIGEWKRMELVEKYQQKHKRKHEKLFLNWKYNKRLRFITYFTTSILFLRLLQVLLLSLKSSCRRRRRSHRFFNVLKNIFKRYSRLFIHADVVVAAVFNRMLTSSENGITRGRGGTFKTV